MWSIREGGLWGPPFGSWSLPATQVPLTAMPCAPCRYLYTHGYNLSVVELVDKIASPPVKKALLHRTYKKLDSWPTPADYAHALQHSARPGQTHLLMHAPTGRLCMHACISALICAGRTTDSKGPPLFQRVRFCVYTLHLVQRFPS